MEGTFFLTFLSTIFRYMACFVSEKLKRMKKKNNYEN